MYNKSVLIGRLSKDVELRYTQNGNATCSFTLACDRKMKNAQGEKQTDFIPVVVPPLRGKLAELCSNYLDKGKLAMVEGEIHVRSYDGQDGNKRWVTEIEAETVKFLSPKDHTEASNGGAERSYAGDISNVGHEVSLDDSDSIPF
jgi:single-strand DNA-binding protein